MDFSEFEVNVKEMKKKLQEAEVKPEDVKIEYTKFDGYDCLWAIEDHKVISYFKW